MDTLHLAVALISQNLALRGQFPINPLDRPISSSPFHVPCSDQAAPLWRDVQARAAAFSAAHKAIRPSANPDSARRIDRSYCAQSSAGNPRRVLQNSVGPPEIETAAPAGTGSGGRWHKSINKENITADRARIAN
jgi:hypothetical protein